MSLRNVGSEPSVALVTGASSGIGQAVAERLASVGLRVYGSSRRTDFRPAAFEPLVMDVTDDASVSRAVASVLQRHGRIDCLVNSAGYALAGPIEETSLDEARAQFEVNLFGVLRVCQAVLPSMRRRRSGRIVNISSIGGLVGLPFQGLYAASKFALEGLSESLRLETRDFGVWVVLVEPGDVRTAITSHRVFTAASTSDSPYHERARRAFAVVEKEERHGIDAGAVAALVVRIAASAPPPASVHGRSSEPASGPVAQARAALVRV